MAKRNVLVVAAHPDDEVLGCGGTICRHVRAGDDVRVFLFTGGRDKIESATRKAFNDAIRKLGARASIACSYPDQNLMNERFTDLVGSLDDTLERIWTWWPDIVYTHFGDDLNSDHRVVSEVVKVLFRPSTDRFVGAIYQFEIPSSTEWGREPFKPDYFVELDEDHLATKMEALQCYSFEMRASPYPRSLEIVKLRMRTRGSEIATRTAEAFQTYRGLWRIG